MGRAGAQGRSSRPVSLAVPLPARGATPGSARGRHFSRKRNAMTDEKPKQPWTPGPWEASPQDRVLTGPQREEFASWILTADDETPVGTRVRYLVIKIVGRSGGVHLGHIELLEALPEHGDEDGGMPGVVLVDLVSTLDDAIATARAMMAKAKGATNG